MIKIALVGDLLITRRIPKEGYSGLAQIIDIFNQHEINFANLETTVHNKEGYPSAFPGGTWMMTQPETLKDLKRLGINLVSTANNHSMDYLHGGLLSTLKHLKKHEILAAGTGENLAEAAKPEYFECKEGRVSLIAATSSFHDSDAAGNQKMDMAGRPGVNPLRHKTIYEITPENYEDLQRIAKSTGINNYHDQAIKEGFLLKRENFNFANFEFIQGHSNCQHTYPLKKDLDRITKAIKEAKKQSDHVMVSIHSHQFTNDNKEDPAEFIKLFSRACIDAGAKIIIGHGPHILRGIEVYKKGIILYGLGNFIFQNETVSYLPAEFYEKYSLEPDDGIGTAMEKRSKNGTIGLSTDEKAWQSVIISIELTKSKISLTAYPIELGAGLPSYKKGFPVISSRQDILENLAALSEPYNTILKIDKQKAIIEVKQ